jgi:hypothetical protein
MSTNSDSTHRIPNAYMWDEGLQKHVYRPLTLEEEAKVMLNEWHGEYDTGYLFSAKRGHIMDAVWHARRMADVLEELLKKR